MLKATAEKYPFELYIHIEQVRNESNFKNLNKTIIFMNHTIESNKNESV